MAWSGAALSSDELAWAADDKPILGSNAAMGALSASRWVAGAAGDFTDPDISDSDYPVSRLFDGLPGLRSKSSTGNETNYTICLDFGAAGIEFDAFLYLNGNLHSTSAVQIGVDICDVNTFGGGTLKTVSTTTITGTSDIRLADLELLYSGGPSVATRFSDVRYVRITLPKGVAYDAQIGQIVFLRRRQLKHQPDMPWDPTDEHSTMDSFATRSGVLYDTVRMQGRRDIDASLVLTTTALQSDITSWWAATNQGTDPFIWIDEPDTTPAGFLFCKLQTPDLDFPYVSWARSARTFRLVGQEQGPNFLALE